MCNLYVSKGNQGAFKYQNYPISIIRPVSSQIVPVHHKHPVRHTSRVDIRKAHRAFLQCPVSPFRTLWNEQLVKRRNGF